MRWRKLTSKGLYTILRSDIMNSELAIVKMNLHELKGHGEAGAFR